MKCCNFVPSDAAACPYSWLNNVDVWGESAKLCDMTFVQISMNLH